MIISESCQVCGKEILKGTDCKACNGYKVVKRKTVYELIIHQYADEVLFERNVSILTCHRFLFMARFRVFYMKILFYLTGDYDTFKWQIEEIETVERVTIIPGDK